MPEPTTSARPTLTPDELLRLTEFARACKAAARAVMLYPAGHPAIGATLGRIVHVTSREALPGPIGITVLPGDLMIDDRGAARTDAAVAELATLLHSHLIGRLTVHPGGDVEAWRAFLLLLGRPAESLRADGGISRVWTTMAGRHLEIEEIDYASVLRERSSGDVAAWDKVIASCLQGSTFELDESTITELLGLAGDADRLHDLLATLETRAGSGATMGVKTAAVLRMLRGILDVVSKNAPEQVEPVLRNMASAVGQFSPDMLLGVLERRRHGDESAQLVQSVVTRMTEGTIANFVARNALSEESATERLAQAFQTLVRDADQQQRLLALAHDDAAASPLGSTEGFEQVWNQVAQKLLTSYSDASYVSDSYGRELSGARAQAVAVEESGDDPPDRVSTWLGTIATSALRTLDLTLLKDLLRIEQDEERWGDLMTPTVSLVEDLLLVGDFDAAAELMSIVVAEATGSGSILHRQHAFIAIDTLVAGTMMRHMVAHLATIDEAQFERLKALCVSFGEVLVRPLAEALSVEDRPRTRERLTALLLAFGAVARRTIERLKGSQNPLVRRTAIQMMREFGGSDALPDLTELLDDSEPQVQREAVRAILNIGTEQAFKILEEALTTGTTRSRDAIMQSISIVRDERATPLFAYILVHVDHRGALAPVYLRAIESLGALKDPSAVAPLKETLRKGEWWAPRRTAALRHAAAAALARIGTADAVAALEEAIAGGSRGIRNAARAPQPNPAPAGPKAER
jgi:HEAT repeat protein